MIRIEHITRSYGDKPVLQDFSMVLPDKGIVRIMGESGIGKTTLLRILAGLEKPDSGKAGDPGRLSMVFQEDRLLEGLSALENVRIAALYAEKHRDPAQILTELGLENDLQTKVRDLSGGMARRVAIARALAREADTYIMDEPIKGLDRQTAENVITVIKKYTEGRLLIVVTHSAEEFDNADITLNI